MCGRSAVGDDHDRARIAGDGSFQVLDQCRGDMIGGLVQQQVDGFTDEARQLDPPPLSIGQLAHFQAEVGGAEQAQRQQVVGVLIRVALPAVGERLRDCQAARPRCLLLLQVPDPAACVHRPLVGPQFTRQHPHQRRLAGPVGPGDQQPLRATDAQRRHVQPSFDTDAGEFRGGPRRPAVGGGHPGGEHQRFGRRRDGVLREPFDALLRVADRAAPGPAPGGGPRGAQPAGIATGVIRRGRRPAG